MQPLSRRTIAAHYLPSRYHYWYALSKLATDPLYTEVRQVFSQTRAGLLDVGCGIGLLPQCLRGSGVEVEYRGIDIDAAKIEIARSAARSGGMLQAVFEVGDLAQGFPQHRGSVALLDVLQYFESVARDDLLASAARCVTAEGRLIIRAGLNDGGWRAALTRGADRAGHAIRWMKTPPRSQPTIADLAQLLARHGFKSEFRPLWGRTPFNNWLVVAQREA
jgi:SAM-dependent methyltransferase